MAVWIQLLRRLEHGPLDVHFDAVDDRLQRVARDPVRTHARRELARDRMHRLTAGLVAARELTPPLRERGALRGWIGDTVDAEVRDVVDRAAERVDGVQRFAARTRQRQEGVIEARATAAREPRGEVRDTHAAGTRVMALSLT